MQHNFVRMLRTVASISFAPVVAHSIGEDISSVVECCSCDAVADGRIALESVFSDTVPEVECAVGTSGAEGAVDGVEGDGVNGVDLRDVVLGWVAVAFEGEVRAASFC